MFDRDLVARVTQLRLDWENSELRESIKRKPEQCGERATLSGIPTKRVYTPEDIEHTTFDEIGFPGRYPFTRGAYPTMYRGRHWTMRQIAGFGTGEDTNERFKYLIAQGQTGLSVDFDMPTLMGYDADDPRSLGEVGREGVAVSSIEDMEALFDGIDLERISVSMTINPTAWILLAMYLAIAESRGCDPKKLSGTVQTDILKEFVAQKEWIFPIRPSTRIVRDLIIYCTERYPRYNPINFSGYHISEAGATAVQEIAFTMANLIACVEEVVRAGVPVDSFAPRLAFFFVAQADFFEEVAKFRAARRIYAKIMKQRFGAECPESMRLRFHCQTAAATLTKPQPINNVVRTTLQALSAVLGGAQSLHTNGLDEAYTIPSEEAMKIALRTQQVIADETRVSDVVDPLGGSYYVETLTAEIENAVFDILQDIDRMGGTITAIEDGYFQRSIAKSAYEIARRKGSGEHVAVGVNKYIDPPETASIETHKVDPTSERRQIDRIKRVRATRNASVVKQLLDQLCQEARDPTQNLMPTTIKLVQARATLGEIVRCLKTELGTYTEKPIF